MSPVQQYIAKQPRAAQPFLRAVRAAIRKALPRAEEGLGYGIPRYVVNGQRVIYFAGWKTYASLYPVSAELARRLGPRAATLKRRVATLQLPFSAPVPAALITRLVKLRAKDEQQRQKSRR